MIKRAEGMRCWSQENQETLKVKDAHIRKSAWLFETCTDQLGPMSDMTVVGIGL